MASFGPSALRQASRLAAKQPSLSSSLRSASRTARVATSLPNTQAASRRSYVSETKRDNAQVAEPKIETAVHLDREALQKSGLAVSGQQEGNMLVSPMAGKQPVLDIHIFDGDVDNV